MNEFITRPHAENVETVPSEEFLENFISFIRSRLNVIGTSLYLLEETLKMEPYKSEKYIQKIYDEIDLIRSIINR